MSVDPFRPIYGAENIAKYIGVSVRNWHQYYRYPMEEYGACWKQNGSKTSKLVTCPILITCFLMVYHAESGGRKI